VSVPPGAKVTVEADSGDLHAQGIDVRDMHANSDSGNVKVTASGTTSRVVALTDPGNVKVAVPHGDYAVETHTDSGDTNIDGISRNDHAPKSIEAKTDSGDITLGSL
jgi:DUF4097 and DUF4098 domain-containing protein YvlB